MIWNSTNGSAPWRRARWWLIGCYLWVLPGSAAASEDEAFLAFLGGWEDANGEAATPLEWQLLLDDAEALAHENDAQVAEGVNNEPEQ